MGAERSVAVSNEATSPGNLVTTVREPLPTRLTRLDPSLPSDSGVPAQRQTLGNFSLSQFN